MNLPAASRGVSVDVDRRAFFVNDIIFQIYIYIVSLFDPHQDYAECILAVRSFKNPIFTAPLLCPPSTRN